MAPNVSTPIYTSTYDQSYAQNIGGILSQENSQIYRLMQQMQLMQEEIQRLRTQSQQPSYNVFDNGFHQELQQQAMYSPSPFGITNQPRNQASYSRNPVVNQMPQESSVSPTKNIPTPAPARNLSDNSNVHHHVSLRFKPKESKYSGGDEEHLQDFIDSYLQTVEYYQLKTREKLQYFHNLFRDDALRFYNAQVKHRCSTFEDAVRIIYKHFKSLDVQQRAKTDLSNSSLSTFAEQEGSATKVLSSLRTFISSRTPQLPPRFRAETNKISFLKQTVLIQPGIKDKLVRINRETRFQSLYSTLENALQLHQKIKQKEVVLLKLFPALNSQIHFLTLLNL